MTASTPWPDPLEEPHFALAEGDADELDAGLSRRVVTAGLSARAGGHYVHPAPEISPVEAFRRAASCLDALLADLSDAEWHADTGVRGLDAQGLVGHLIGVELDFQAGLAGDASAATDHVVGTQGRARAQRALPPAQTLLHWRHAVAETLAGLAPLERADAAMAALVRLHSVHMPLGELLVARTFELWAHEDDIRRGNRRALSSPDASSLQLMTELAVSMVPFAAPAPGRDRAGARPRRARIVLTGPGGGSWTSDLDHSVGLADGHDGVAVGEDGPADVRIVVDAIDFCRLFANRMDPRAMTVDVTGDATLGRDLLVGLTALALD